MCVDLSQDASMLVAATAQKCFTVFEFDKGEAFPGELPPMIIVEADTIHAPADKILALKISPQGHRIAFALDEGFVFVYDAHKHEDMVTFSDHKGSVHCVAWSSDGKLIASGGDDFKVLVWDAKTGVLVKRPLIRHRGCVTCVAFGQGKKHLVSASKDATIVVWKLNTGNRAAVSCVLEGHTYWITSLALSPDDRYVVSVSVDKSARVWDIASGTQIRELSGYVHASCVAWALDDSCIVSGGEDGTVRVWDVDATVRCMNVWHIVCM